MDGKLVGVHRVRAKLANGDTVEYHYAWRGGPRMTTKPGTKAFTQEYVRLSKDRPRKVAAESFGQIITDYLASAEYQGLRPSTKRDYDRIIGIIRTQYDALPIAAIDAKGARRVFLDWRDTMRDTPRSADMHMAVLGRIISWAKNREIVAKNPLERIGKLHSGNRKDVIWMPSQLAAIMNAAPHIVNVVKVALWTMQRQGDVLKLPTIAYDDGRLWITQGKTGARVRIRPANEILPLLTDAKDKKRQRILVNSFGQNWTSDGFRSSWGKELARLKIEGVTFHDLRGTGITYAYANGMDIERIAEISGHSKTECESIIRKNYLAGGDVIDAIRAGTKGA